MKDFQSKTQLRMLQVHAYLCKVASFLYTPVRYVQEQCTSTPMFREENARKLKVVK